MKSKKLKIEEKQVFVKIEKQIADKKYTCLYDGCNKNAIKSHSQQRNGPLKAISENNHVYALDDNLQRSLDMKVDDFVFKFMLKGTKETSIFPGFCPEHEELFSIFEHESLDVNNKQQACTLFYRTMCYEKSRKRREYERWKMLDEMFYSKHYSFNLEGALQIEYMNEHIKVTCEHHIKTAYDMIKNNNFDMLSFHWIRLPYNINVSCSSVINLHLDEYLSYCEKNKGKPIPSFSFNIIPNNHETHVIFSWLSEYDEHAQWILNSTASNELLEKTINRLAFCESEDVTINPTLWRSIKNENSIMSNMRHSLVRGKLQDKNIPKIIKLI